MCSFAHSTTYSICIWLDFINSVILSLITTGRKKNIINSMHINTIRWRYAHICQHAEHDNIYIKKSKKNEQKDKYTKKNYTNSIDFIEYWLYNTRMVCWCWYDYRFVTIRCLCENRYYYLDFWCNQINIVDSQSNSKKLKIQMVFVCSIKSMVSMTHSYRNECVSENCQTDSISCYLVFALISVVNMVLVLILKKLKKNSNANNKNTFTISYAVCMYIYDRNLGIVILEQQSSKTLAIGWKFNFK